MITFTSTELNTWISALLWPLTRILGLIAVAPLLGNRSIPKRVKLGLGIVLALVIAPTVPALPAADPLSWSGLLILLQQLLIGLGMGFAMRIVFAGVELAGEIAGLTMGFGFATFFDPQTSARSSSLTQLLALLTLLLFLTADMHLVLLATLAESFVNLPIGTLSLSGAGFSHIARWGAQIFIAGVQLSLPIVAALLLVNFALGILTRAAPQLNLFGIGFPVTLSAGFIMVALALPFLLTPILRMLQDGLELVRHIPVSLLPVPGR